MSQDVLRVREVEARVVPHRWAWAEANERRIAENWLRRSALTPDVFDGAVLMIAGLERLGETIEARFFETRYSRLLANVDLGGDGSVGNGFAMGVLQGADGGFVLGEMAAHTANAGRLYFPAGTPDLSDVMEDGRVDLAGSILREIAEETGLGPDLCRLAEGWDVVVRDGRTAFLRGVRLSIPADEAVRRIEAYIGREAKPELARIEVIRKPEEIEDVRMPSFLPDYLRGLMAAPDQG